MRRPTLIILVLIGVYILKLAYSGLLSYYIHPRYAPWAVLAALVTLLVGILAVWYRKQTHDHQEKNRLTTLMIVILLAAIFIPARPLESSASLGRFQPGVPLGPNAAYLLSSPVDSTASNLTIREWIILLYRKDVDISVYQGRTVDLTGFLYPGNNKLFYVSRFIVTCCTADATPVGIPVSYELSKDLKANDWVRVIGTISVVGSGDSATLTIMPTSVTKVSQPQVPYIY